MTTRQELEKMVEVEARNLYGEDPDPVYEIIWKSGAEFVMYKLVPEIERLQKENERLFSTLTEVTINHPCYQLSKQLEKELTELRRQNEIMAESLREIANQKISGSQVYDASELMVEIAREALAKCGKVEK